MREYVIREREMKMNERMRNEMTKEKDGRDEMHKDDG